MLDAPGVGAGEEILLSPPVFPPVGAVDARRQGDVLRLVIRAPTGPGDSRLPDSVVGQLPVLGRDPQTGSFVVRTLRVPTPEPFDDAGLETMWQAACELPPDVPASVRHQGIRSARPVLPAWDAVNVMHVPGLAAIAKHLVSHWPRREALGEIWRAVELPGGRENPAQTARRYRGSAIAALEHGVPLPRRSVRAVPFAEPWHSQGVSQVAAEVLRRLRAVESIHDGQTSALARPLQAVAHLAASSAAPDLPPSSWPSSLRTFYDSALNVLATLGLAGEGKAAVPLCHLWQLYECWVSHSLLLELRRMLGAPLHAPEVVGTTSRGMPTWRAVWRSAAGPVELWSQVEIGPSGIVLSGKPMQATISSVTASIIPDALVVVARGDAPVYVAFDAKHRRAAKMSAGDVAAAAGKYLWGLRRSTDLLLHALETVVIVSSGGGEPMFHAPLARIEAVRAVPGHVPLRLTRQMLGL